MIDKYDRLTLDRYDRYRSTLFLIILILMILILMIMIVIVIHLPNITRIGRTEKNSTGLRQGEALLYRQLFVNASIMINNLLVYTIILTIVVFCCIPH